MRSCRATDYQFVADLSRQNMEEYTKEYWGNWDSKKFKTNLKKENITIISYGNKKVGFFDITRDKDAAYLHNLQVINNFQGQGIGASIMTNIEIAEKEAGISKITAQVFKNNPARFFYRKLGYKVIKRGPHSLTIEKTL